MKTILKLCCVFFLSQSFQCEDQIVEKSRTDYINQLQNEKQFILDYIASFSCNENIGCSSIAFGSKPCGGPWEYLAHSNAVDIVYLTNLVTNYNALEASYNDAFEIVSDCAVVNPPSTINCIDGVCTIIH
ncbi:conserved hypothetical protein [Flavobacterium sp. 9AF]|uniref:hypothetical protein n=1 Tax=Flavobacterium sp. 9AF TaxID=2653142 RepID=UPI0012F02BE3|nr:hypothetical protein [Flavobacterium sp. 9AF]VXB17898.1 conserved hypothetical protein [Flavobacterium sp. 9AF]